MIRNVEDVGALLDRHFGGAAHRPLSLIRIGAWALIGLLAIGLVLPTHQPANNNIYNRKIKTHWVRDVTLDHNDPRGFLLPKRDSHEFRIAWIGPSTLQSIRPGHYTFIPADVRQRLPRIDGRPVRIDMYFLSAARVLDLYSATLSALARKPDLILVDLNPLWLFNDTAVQSWPNLNDVTFPFAVRNVGAWPVVGAFYTPQDMALGLASRLFPSIRNRWTYADSLRTRLDRLWPLKTAPPTVPTTPSVLDQVAALPAPLQFWQQFRPIVDPKAPMDVRQLALLKQSRTDGRTVNDRIMGLMLGTLASSHIPAIAYVPPIDPSSLRAPKVDAALRDIEDHLRHIADEHRARTLLVQWQSAVRFLPPMQFNDLVHLADDGPFVTYLATTICRQLKIVDPGIACTPQTPRSRP